MLPFNLLPALEGTGIAASFGLKSGPADNQTAVDLAARDAEDLVRLLRALKGELETRAERLRKRDTQSPLGNCRRAHTDERLAQVNRAVELLAAHL
jgi:hypothetical protein